LQRSCRFDLGQVAPHLQAGERLVARRQTFQPKPAAGALVEVLRELRLLFDR